MPPKWTKQLKQKKANDSSVLERRQEVSGRVRVAPLGVDALVEVHEHRVLRLHDVAEVALHVAVRAQRLPDVAAAAVAGAQLDGLEPVDVLGVEEHVADDGVLVADAPRVAAEHDALQHDPVRLHAQQAARRHQRLLAYKRERCWIIELANIQENGIFFLLC